MLDLLKKIFDIEQGLNCLTEIIYFCYIWISIILGAIYIAESIILRKHGFAKRTLTTRFKYQSGNDIRQSVERVFYTRLGFMNLFNAILSEIIRNTCLNYEIKFSFTIVFLCIVMSLIETLVYFIRFCKKNRVLPSWVYKKAIMINKTQNYL